MWAMQPAAGAATRPRCSRGWKKKRWKTWYTLERAPTASPPGLSLTTETMARTSDKA